MAWQGERVTAREDFTDDQWYRLRSAPWQAAMGVIEVDASGTLTVGRELEAVEAELAAVQFDEGLRGLVTRDLLDADKVGGEDKPSAGATAAAAAGAGEDDFPHLVIEAMAGVAEVLDDKVDADEAVAFRQWLVRLAEAAAEAGKEGVAGLTGPKVSDAEYAYLVELRTALGLE